MKVDIEDVMFWMDAIRNSEDRYRTLESFWKGQIRSKIWLIETLEEIVTRTQNRIVIHGGWNGVLASLIFNSNIDIYNIKSLDIDPVTIPIASTINKRQEIQGKFSAILADMCDYKYDADIVINTSCEHLTQTQYESWLSNVPLHSLIVLQSNNYSELEEHINCVINLEDFTEKAKIKPFWRGEYKTEKYTRFMIIGKK